MMNVKNVEGSCHSLIIAVSQHFPGGIEENLSLPLYGSTALWTLDTFSVS
jgi:hypothetical protein